MTFAAAFTALEALNYNGVSVGGVTLKYRGFSNPLPPYLPDLPCVITLLSDGNDGLDDVAIDASKGLAVVFLRQLILVKPVTQPPSNPFDYWDGYLGLWVGNLTLAGALLEPIRFSLFRAGAIEYRGNNYWGLGVKLRLACEVT